MAGPSESEARYFARAFRSFLEWVHSGYFETRERNEVVALVADFLGDEGLERSVVARSLPVFEHVNLQTALNAWSARARAIGGGSRHHDPPAPPPVTLQQLVTGEGIPPLRLSAPPSSICRTGRTRRWRVCCSPLLLVDDAHGRYVVMVIGPTEHHHGLDVEIAGLPVDAAQAVHAELDELRNRLNVYRGHVLEVGITPMGGVSLDVRRGSARPREDVVLPEAVLARVERHALGRRHAPRGAARRRPAPQARAAAVRAAWYRQDAHDPLPGRPDGRLHPAAADRPCAARDRLRGRARARPAAGGHRARGRRPGRRGPQFRTRLQPGPLRPPRRDGRSRARRRPAVRPDHQPRRPARAGAGGSAGPGRRRGRDRPPRRRRAQTTARAVRPLGPAAALRRRRARDRRAHRRRDRIVPQGAVAPRGARVAGTPLGTG